MNDFGLRAGKSFRGGIRHIIVNDQNDIGIGDGICLPAATVLFHAGTEGMRVREVHPYLTGDNRGAQGLGQFYQRRHRLMVPAGVAGYYQRAFRLNQYLGCLTEAVNIKRRG